MNEKSGSINYFTVFNLPTQFSLDMAQLSERYKALQRRFHPDCFLGSSQVEYLKAVEYSSVINKAWQTLRLPLNRAEHLLLLNGFNSEKEVMSRDKDFINIQFLLHEELEQIESTLEKKLLIEFVHRINSMLAIFYDKLTKECNDRQWEKSIVTVYKLRFMNKLQARVDLIEEKLLDFQS
jgi:molecular chaperone HscB